MIFPKAKAILAMLIVIRVKSKVFTDLIYLMISRKIDKLTIVIKIDKISTLLTRFISWNKIIKKISKIDNGRSGWNPLKPELNLTKLNKSIPKVNLCKKNPNIRLSL